LNSRAKTLHRAGLDKDKIEFLYRFPVIEKTENLVGTVVFKISSLVAVWSSQSPKQSTVKSDIHG